MNYEPISLATNQYRDISLCPSVLGFPVQSLLLICGTLFVGSWFGYTLACVSVGYVGHIFIKRKFAREYHELPYPIYQPGLAGQSKLYVKGLPEQFYKDFQALAETCSEVCIARPKKLRYLELSLKRVAARHGANLRSVDADFVALEHPVADIELAREYCVRSRRPVIPQNPVAIEDLAENNTTQNQETKEDLLTEKNKRKVILD
ncbi:hypothetical protein [Vibrio cholerae]|uniref:hypothetical protein n=1 Tax=Vibrio cholerae TaxID=666 RepID=UPI00216037CA|nr:hypothetical protein [Vibrio cholerae]MCS0096625.1 hypothetical protein [Vibrio cholerae]